jgi:hypothetical protein
MPATQLRSPHNQNVFPGDLSLAGGEPRLAPLAVRHRMLYELRELSKGCLGEIPVTCLTPRKEEETLTSVTGIEIEKNNHRFPQ